MLKHYVLWMGFAVVLSLGIALAQQPPSPDCQQELAMALHRSIQQQQLAMQEREALTRYLQQQLVKVTQERDDLQRQMNEKKPPVAAKD